MKYLCILFVFILVSCEFRTIKDSGLNDLMVGVQQFIMYDNGDFILELGLGSKDGKYKANGDTVYLNYDEVNKDWPDKVLITEKYFITIPKTGHKDTVKIERHSKN